MATDRATCRGRLGLAGLLIAVSIGMMAPVIGGLDSSSPDYEGVRLEPGVSMPLPANSEVALDSGDGAIRMGDCLIAGPGAWLRRIVGASAKSDFRTGPAGEYKITCAGGAVEVESNVSGHPAADPDQNRGHRVTTALFAVAGLLGVAGVGVLVASARAGGERDTSDGGDSPHGIESEAGADEPEVH